MKAKYDQIGINYANKRKSDPRIAAMIHEKLSLAQRIVNIGAGPGSYEPADKDLIAVEPSLEMIGQRPRNAHPVVQGTAESLPFPDNSFTHAMTILSMHHWTDRTKAFKEINRVASEGFVALTWDPDADPFWLTRDYFTEIIDHDKNIFPRTEELSAYFDNLKVEPLSIPEDCIDGFLAAYWKRPSEYLDVEVRNSISSFSRLADVSKGLQELETDIVSDRWSEINASILSESSLDVGYVVITGEVKKDH